MGSLLNPANDMDDVVMDPKDAAGRGTRATFRLQGGAAAKREKTMTTVTQASAKATSTTTAKITSTAFSETGGGGDAERNWIQEVLE